MKEKTVKLMALINNQQLTIVNFQPQSQVLVTSYTYLPSHPPLCPSHAGAPSCGPSLPFLDDSLLLKGKRSSRQNQRKWGLFRDQNLLVFIGTVSVSLRKVKKGCRDIPVTQGSAYGQHVPESFPQSPCQNS